MHGALWVWGAMTTRQQLHRDAVAWVRRQLRRHGVRTALSERATANTLYSGDLVADGLTIGVKAARAKPRLHQVQVNGRTYSYRYSEFSWCIHTHAQRMHVGVWVLVGLDRGKRVAFVVPDSAFSRKVVRVMARGRTRLEIYRGAWGIVGGMVEARRMRAA